MAATSGMATLGRLGVVLEQPAKIAAAINGTAKRLSREHRMKNVPNRKIRWFGRTPSAVSLCFESGHFRTNSGRLARRLPVHKSPAATEQGQKLPQMNTGRSQLQPDSAF
jgi:hypothetical protein